MRIQFRRPAILLAFLLAIAGLFGCGGGGTKTVTTTSTVTTAPTTAPTLAAPALGAPLKRACPPGQSFAGCSVLPTVSKPNALLAAPPATALGTPKFPDVSVWQGHVDWPAVAAWQRSHGWPTGGIFKMGEYHADPRAAENSAATKSLNWRQGYWFVRNTGCVGEANQIIAAARLYGLKVVQLDLEVPEARGYGLCLSPPLQRAGLVVGEYTGPGTNPGGVNTRLPLWEATYGSGFNPVWQPVVAWQCTDGVFGCVTFVPGIGRDDVSYDFGISKLGGPPPPPPDPFRVLEHTVRHFGKDSAREYNTARNWVTWGCKVPPLRRKCRTTYHHLWLLAHRIWVIGHPPHHKSTMNLFKRNERFGLLYRLLYPKHG